MSHTTTMQQKVTNIDLFCRLAKQRGHTAKQAEAGKNLNVAHYGNNAVGDAVAEVKLQDWLYPLAIKSNGEVLFDHFGSVPSSMQTFKDLMQEYNQEVIIGNLPYDQLSNWTTKKVANGDVVITLEF